MLDVRSIHVSHNWEAYQSYRIERETNRLYPERDRSNENSKVPQSGRPVTPDLF
jgi:hypothetical protein